MHRPPRAPTDYANTFRDELAQLQTDALGSPPVAIGVIDGAPNLDHPALRGLTARTALDHTVTGESARNHATEVLGLIAGNGAGGTLCVAPQTTVVLAPILRSDEGLPVSDAGMLIHAIHVCVDAGVRVLNISAGLPVDPTTPFVELERALDRCAREGVLVVAAAGNSGCDCEELPARYPGVLVVGAAEPDGRPAAFSNFAKSYVAHGLLALGSNLLAPTGHAEKRLVSGSSYACALTSGVAALLIGSAEKHAVSLSADRLLRALVGSADVCANGASQRCLAGLLHPARARGLLISTEEKTTMPATTRTASDAVALEPDSTEITPLAAPPPDERSPVSARCAGGCSCSGKPQPALAYALGELGYDFGSEARRDSFIAAAGTPSVVSDPLVLSKHLDENDWDAESLTWVLELNSVPIYAVRGTGAYGAKVYELLRQFLRGQHDNEGLIERVSVPGYVSGSTRLLSGQELPVLWASPRGMYAWSRSSLVKSLAAASPSAAVQEEQLTTFLDRVYFELRNRGISPEERALNYAATNAYMAERVFEKATAQDLELDTIHVEASPVARPGTLSFDVVMVFFHPNDSKNRARKMFRFTVDVSDVIPVQVGPVRAWSKY